MNEQLTLAETPAAAPDPWPAMRAAHPGKPLVRRIFVDEGREDWIVPEGDLAPFHDGATIFIYATPPAHVQQPADHADLVELYNRLHDEAHRERCA